MNRRVFVSIIALAWADAGWAELTATPPAATVISPDTLAGRSLGTTTSTLGTVTTIDGGTVSGTNLFHSFSTFDLATGDTAAWVHSAGDPASIGNVINRVTGGTASQIFGTIDSTALPNADFFFINPAGIVFGQGAQVNVPAAAHFSTASNLHFDNGDTLAIAAPDGSTLSVASPTAFGFLGNEGDILMSGAGRTKYGAEPEFSPGAQSVHLSGHDVSLIGSGIRATGISIAAVGAVNALVPLDGQVDGLQGSLILSDYTHLNSAEPGSGGYQSFLGSGDITIRSGSLTTNLAFFDTQGYDGEQSGNVDIGVTGHADMIFTEIDTTGAYGSDGGDISVTAGSLFMDGSGISTTSDIGNGEGGQVSVAIGGNLLMSASEITTTSNGNGNGGLIGAFVGGELALTNGSSIVANAFGDGRTGSVQIGAGTLTLMDGSAVATNALGTGDGGSITVAVGDLSLTDSKVSATSGIKDSPAGTTGRAGDIQVFADSLSLTGSLIQVDAFDDGDGGSVDIQVSGDIQMASTLLPDFAVGSEIASNAWRNGGGGDVTITAGGNVSMFQSAISSRAGISLGLNRGPGQGGNVSLNATGLQMTDAVIQSNARGQADGGTVNIALSDALTMDFSRISTFSLGSGIAGQINISTGFASLFASQISSEALETGTGGAVQLSVFDQLFMDSTKISSDALSPTGAGNAGDVAVSAGILTMVNGAEIGSSAIGDGQGGFVLVSSDSAYLFNALIQSNALGVGDAGGISISSGLLYLAENSIVQSTSYGEGQGGAVFINAGLLTATDGSLIAADSLGAGNAGGVFIDAGLVSLSNGAILASRSAGSGSGGLVSVNTDFLDMSSTSWIQTDSFGSGDAGNIFINANGVAVSSSAIQSTAYGDGNAGDVALYVAGQLLIENGARISSDSGTFASPDSEGNAGTVFVSADDLIMLGGFITSTAYAGGDSGTIDVDVANSLYLFTGAISSNAELGDAGSVSVSAPFMDLSYGSITSDSHGGDGGDVTVSAAANLSLLGSTITTNAGAGFDSADTGKGGNINVTAGNLVMNSSEVASRAIGQGDGGTISIEVDNYLGLFGHSKIYTDTTGAGLAGLVTVSAFEMDLDASLITSNSDGSGDAGGVSVTAHNAYLSNQSKISSDASGSGDAGVTFLDIAGALTLDSGSFVSSDSFDVGNAGGVVIDAGEVYVRGPSSISSNAYGDGDGGAVYIHASKLVELTDGGRISSDVFGAGDGGDVLLGAPTIKLLDNSSISSDAQFGSSGNAGNVEVSGGTVQLSNASWITSDAGGEGDAGEVMVSADNLLLDGLSYLSSSTFGAGDAGGITVTGGAVTMNDSFMFSDAEASGNAGGVTLDVDQLTMNFGAIRSEAASTGSGGIIDITVAGDMKLSDAAITTNAQDIGNPGNIFVEAGTISLAGSAIASESFSPMSIGLSGTIFVETDLLDMSGGSVISTSATFNAGDIFITADSLRMTGEGTAIASEKGCCDDVPGEIGDINIVTNSARLSEGASITTNANTGEAGNISILMSPDSILILEGKELPASISTSSGLGTGGKITIASPLAIISNGGSILAQGEFGGANVVIDTQYFITSSDRPNVVAVDGSLSFTNSIYDVSSGTVDADLTPIDASGVLRGQCSAMRTVGSVSQLNLRPVGPFGSPVIAAAQPSSAASAGGGCL